MTLLLADTSFWQRVLTNDFYHYALAGGTGIALLCGLLSPLVLLKRMAFIGQGISHAAFGGAGVAMLAGVLVAGLRPPLARDAIILVFCVATAVMIGRLARKGRVTEDASIGIFLVAAMAAGVLLMDLRGLLAQWLVDTGRADWLDLGAPPDFHALLFGNILMISPLDAAIAWGLAIAAALLLAGTFKELVLFVFDAEAAAVFGVRTGVFYYGLLICLSVAVVAAMRSLGVILAGALLILPGACAQCWVRRIGWTLVLSAAIGVAGLTAGLLLAVWLGEVSPGPVIALTLFGAFLLSSFARARRQKPRTPDASTEAAHDHPHDH